MELNLMKTFTTYCAKNHGYLSFKNFCTMSSSDECCDLMFLQKLFPDQKHFYSHLIYLAFPSRMLWHILVLSSFSFESYIITLLPE